eukprot:scaffold10193_cov107-Isochrysis_galbana.AAC.8
MRVAQLGRHVEAEVGVVFDDRVADAERIHPAALEDLLEQYWLNDRIELLAHVLEQRGLAKLDRILERSHKITIGQLEGDEAC